MTSLFNYIFPFGKENSVVVYDLHTLLSLSDYGNLDDDEFYVNTHHLDATIHKHHDPENNIDVFILYFSVEHHEAYDPDNGLGVKKKKLTLVFDTVEECISFLVPYLMENKETLDFYSTYHEDFHGKGNSKD